MKVLVTGASGQLGTEVARIFGRYGVPVVCGARRASLHKMLGLIRSEIDLRYPIALKAQLSALYPDLIINCAAFTQVDLAESYPQSAFTVNALSVKEIGEWAAAFNARVIHISTDYVYDVPEPRPITESDPTNPKNVYGVTKLQGEIYLEEAGCDYKILRTSWLYGGEQSFVHKIYSKCLAGTPEIPVVKEVGSLTYAPTLATVIFALGTGRYWADSPRIMNIADGGYPSRKEIAEKIVSLFSFRTDIVEVENYPTCAVRPSNSRLDLTLMKQHLIQPLDWACNLELWASQKNPT